MLGVAAMVGSAPTGKYGKRALMPRAERSTPLVRVHPLAPHGPVSAYAARSRAPSGFHPHTRTTSVFHAPLESAVLALEPSERASEVHVVATPTRA